MTGETVWMQEPLNLGFICLPSTQVKLGGHFGKILTKSSVVRDELDKGRYILGSRVAVYISKFQKTVFL